LAALALVPLVAVAYALRKRPAPTSADIKLSNPLQLSAAFGFGVLLMLLFVAAEGLRRWLGDAGAYAMAAVAGVLDVDAASIALAQGAAVGNLETTTAARAIALATLVNTGVKAVLAAALGGLPMLRSASAVLAAALVAGAVTAVVTL
jgi:uncharacterized membrane protein (DUF4010 family)